jgi:hypothetical protein
LGLAVGRGGGGGGGGTGAFGVGALGVGTERGQGFDAAVGAEGAARRRRLLS